MACASLSGVEDLKTPSEHLLKILDRSDEQRKNVEESNPDDPLFFCKRFYKQEFESLGYEELIVQSKDLLKFELTESDCKYIESLTAQQSGSKDWHKFRTGRITASNFKTACCSRSSVSKPSMSSIKRICFPEYGLRSEASSYGIRNENEAYNKLKLEMEKVHTNYKQAKTGLIVRPNYKVFGASPDGISHCSYCGVQAIEIKCPFILKDDQPIKTLLDMKDPYIKVTEDNKFEVIKKHECYYQMQMQMALLDCKSCLFVIWSPKVFEVIKVERNEQFWEEKFPKANTFFENFIVPELMGKYFTKNITRLSTDSITE